MKRYLLATALAALASAATAQQFQDPYGDATVSRADAAKHADERFAALDTNHDGFLSPEEIQAGGPGGGLRRADADGDGKISKAEFAAAQLRRFDMIDADHDGQLTKAERDTAREQMRSRGGPGGPGGFGPPPGGQ